VGASLALPLVAQAFCRKNSVSLLALALASRSGVAQPRDFTWGLGISRGPCDLAKAAERRAPSFQYFDFFLAFFFLVAMISLPWWQGWLKSRALIALDLSLVLALLPNGTMA
jgi:hypothetical protein